MSTPRACTTAPDLQRRAAELIDGFVFTQLCYVATELGVLEHLARGPVTSCDLATAAGADPGNLRRVLRGLAAAEVLVEHPDDRFELSPIGLVLDDRRDAILARGRLYYDAAAGLVDAVRQGGPAFEHHHHAAFFDHLGRHPHQEATFHASMATRSRGEADAVVGAYDFAGAGDIADIGGGSGTLLAAVLEAAPLSGGVLLDRELVIDRARAHLESRGLASRARCVAGDFFDDVPPADTYLLSRVLHDWDDDDATRILRTCRRRMHPDSRLLVIEAILPERAADNPATILMDLHMLLLFAARERTLPQYVDLLEAADLQLTRHVPAVANDGLAILEAVPRGSVARLR